MEQVILAFARRFAEQGYFVFPFYGSSKGPQKPFGWARNKPGTDVAEEKVIPGSDDPSFVDEWPDRVARGYDAPIVGYGVMGVNCVIFDLDVKDGKDGKAEFKKLQDRYKIPEPTFVVRSKSGGYHLYYDKPDRLKAIGIKSVAGISVGGTKYPGVDVRGDGGMVVGPLSEGNWEEGKYTIVKGGPEVELSLLPDDLLMALSKSSAGMEVEETLKPMARSDDEMDILKRGEIPPKLSNGNRNNGFFLFLNALRNKGFSAETARQYAEKLIEVTEGRETLHESVDIDDMIRRIWTVDLSNPYDTARDIIDSGLYRLTAMKSKITYIMLNENAYIDSRDPHDLASMKQLLARYSRKMVGENGKAKNVNPAELLDGLITPDREVSTVGYNPGASEVFTLTAADGGRRYLNTWEDPRKHIVHQSYSEKYWVQFTLLVSRIFGPPGSDEYQLGLDFLAFLLQRPGIKPVVAPFIMSRRRGVGKSLYFKVAGQIFGFNKQGDMQARYNRVDQIEGRFFDPSGASLLMFDEVQFPVHRNMRMESANFWKHLKNLVTAETIAVEIKGGGTFQQPNLAAIMMAGNTGNNFPVEEFDRRIWLIDNDPPDLEEGLLDEFFLMTKHEMSREQKREIINCLLSRLSEHRIKLPLDRMRAPMNEIKKEMYLATLSDIEEWWITHFEDRENLLSVTPILNKSAILYLIATSDRLVNSRWREDPEGTFRELKRRGLIHPVRTQGDNYQTRNIRNVPIVKIDGSVMMDGEGRDVLYTTRQHGDFNSESNEVVMQALFANLNSIKRYKEQTSRNRSAQIANQLS